MNTAPHASSKVSAAHLRRGAYLYVRQSTTGPPAAPGEEG
jgi:hypothetical protein